MSGLSQGFDCHGQSSSLVLVTPVSSPSPFHKLAPFMEETQNITYVYEAQNKAQRGEGAVVGCASLTWLTWG